MANCLQCRRGGNVMEKKAKIQFLIVAIIASILSVGLAFYVLSPKSEPSVIEDDYSQKEHANHSLKLEEVYSPLKTEEPEETEKKNEDVEEQPEKEATDEKTEREQEPESEQKPSEGKKQEGEIVENEEEKPVAPKKD